MASLAQPSKRAATEEFESLDVASPIKAAKLHGVVTDVSPMKCGKGKSSYFHGQLADGTSAVRVIGFDQEQQKKMALHCNKKEPIVLDNCQVQKSKHDDTFEVIVKKFCPLQRK